MNSLFNKKLIGLFFITAILTFSCKKRESDDRPNFPSAEFYSPWYVTPGDTVIIGGNNLKGSEVYINGDKVELIQNGEVLSFLVPNDFQGGTIKVEYLNGEQFTFADSLHWVQVNDPRKTNLEGILLISNFDGGGIRPTTLGSDFTTGSWESEAPFGAETGVGTNYNDVVSLAGGNCYYHYVPDGAIGGIETSGWGGILKSRNELMNDNESSFPESFADYPNSPLDFEGDPSKYYLNFYYKTEVLEMNQNGENPTEIRISLINPSLNAEEQFSFTISNGDNMEGAFANIEMPSDEKWHAISISLSDFKTNYGFNTNPNFISSELKQFNAIQFTFIDSRVNSTDPEEKKEANGPLKVFIDQVSISKGVAIYSHIILCSFNPFKNKCNFFWKDCFRSAC